MSANVYTVVMAGGSGTRFWPASRRRWPKQLLPLGGDAPLLQQTLARVAPLCPPERLLVATGAALVEPTLRAVPTLSRAQLLVEPVGRNTAPCLGWAAATVARRDPEAVVMALPADPHIADPAAFVAAARRAIESAAGGTVTTIGIRPTHPETGYGYIEAEPGAGPVWAVKRFVEKPDAARAAAFVAAGTFLWNAGMFFFRAADLLAAIAQHLPALAEGLAELDAAAAAGSEEQAVAALFPRLPAVSIDVGVMEKMDRLACVPGDFGWSDLGSWPAVAALAEHDARGNSVAATTVLLDASGNHVVDLRTGPTPRVAALVGVSDLIVVQTDDALLVVHRDRAQDVREIVEVLKRRGDDGLW